jgi:hypothetical protein
LRSSHAGEWKYNYNYWTGGFKYNESDIPQWSMDNSTIGESVITWALDKKAAFNCLHYKINDKSGNRSVSWSYKNCSSKFIAACRVYILTEIFLQFLMNLNIFKKKEQRCTRNCVKVCHWKKRCIRLKVDIWINISNILSQFQHRVACSTAQTERC